MRKILTEYYAEEVLKKFKIPISNRYLAQNLEEVYKYAKKLKFPIDLKIMSEQVFHKSDIGGVRVCPTKDDLKKEYEEIMKIVKRRNIKLQGVLVQEYFVGKELLIGLKKDPTFSHVIGLGMGGIYTEFFKDIEFRACPINEDDAKSMIEGLKAVTILKGVRGEKPINLKLLKKTLVNVSKIPKKYPNLVELDINPFIMNENKGKAVDALMILD